ncbi:MAG: hypothetical protein ABSA12_01600 [Verrucomicrobiia bacterium]
MDLPSVSKLEGMRELRPRGTVVLRVLELAVEHLPTSKGGVKKLKTALRTTVEFNDRIFGQMTPRHFTQLGAELRPQRAQLTARQAIHGALMIVATHRADPRCLIGFLIRNVHGYPSIQLGESPPRDVTSALDRYVLFNPRIPSDSSLH